MFKAFVFWLATMGLSHGALNDFSLSVDDVTMTISDTVAATEAINLIYTYPGPTDTNLTAEFKIFDTDCLNLKADDTNSQGFAIYKTNIDLTGTSGKIDVDVGMNLATLSTSSAYSSTGTSTADITLCGRLELYYGDGTSVNKVFVNYHETNVAAQLTLTGTDGFNLDGITYNVVEADEAEDLTNAVQIDYPVTVWKCDVNGAVDTSVTTVNQATPVYICVDYKGADAVHVSAIQQFQYWSTDTDGSNPTAAIVGVSGGELQDLATDVNCDSVAEVCIIGFIVDGSKFADSVTTKLAISGVAVIEVGLQALSRVLDCVQIAQICFSTAL